MIQRKAVQKKRGVSFVKFVMIGCLSIIVLLVIGGLIAFFGIRSYMSNLLEKYTETEPRALPELTFSEAEAQRVVARMDAFKKAVEESTPTEPLVLTGDEVNMLIHHHPQWKPLAGKVYVTIEEDKIQGQVSVSLEEFGEFIKGRFLNGSAIFNVGLTAGRLFVFVESVEVKENPLPDELMQKLRSKNLAEDADPDPELTALIEKLESITVENGKLHIVPKNVK